MIEQFAVALTIAALTLGLFRYVPTSHTFRVWCSLAGIVNAPLSWGWLDGQDYAYTPRTACALIVAVALAVAPWLPARYDGALE